MFGMIFFIVYASFASVIGMSILDKGLEQFLVIGSVFIAYFVIGRFFSHKSFGQTFREELLISIVVFLGTVVWGVGLVKGIEVLFRIDLVKLAQDANLHLNAMGIITSIVSGFCLGKYGMIEPDPKDF